MPTGKEWEVRLRFHGSTGQAAVPATLTHRSKGEDSEERECHQEQELRARDPLGQLQPCPKDGECLVPNQNSPLENHISKVLL